MSQEQGPLQVSIDRVRGELDRLVESVRDRSGKALDAVGIKGGRPEFPPIDLTETNDAVHLFADLPGVDLALLDLRVSGATLLLRGTVERPPLGQGGTIHRNERHLGPFERRIPLPASVSAEAATAELTQGVLHARFPKSATEVGHKVLVRGQSASASTADPHLPPAAM